MTLSRTTPIRRTGFARPTLAEAHFAAEPICCKHCKEKFTPVRAGQVVHLDCAVPYVQATNAKKRAAVVKAEKRVDRTKKQALKTIADLIREAQTAFNAFIRRRDQLAGHCCISSGRPLDWSGNAVDAGHYRSRGAAPHLRFNEANCHAQSKRENRYGSGNVTDYRLGLIERIGLPAVEALESNNEVHKWGRDELIAIRAMYVRRLKELNATSATSLESQ